MRRLSGLPRTATAGGRRFGLGLALALASLGCEDQSYRRIGGDINVLVKRGGSGEAQPARVRLVGHGRRAIPQIETALHTAAESGRLHLVAALDAIGDGEAIPVLRHFAVYDGSAEVRAACESVLKGWAARGEQGAKAALARVADLRGKGEGPTPPRF